MADDVSTLAEMGIAVRETRDGLRLLAHDSRSKHIEIGPFGKPFIDPYRGKFGHEWAAEDGMSAVEEFMFDPKLALVVTSGGLLVVVYHPGSLLITQSVQWFGSEKRRRSAGE